MKKIIIFLLIFLNFGCISKKNLPKLSDKDIQKNFTYKISNNFKYSPKWWESFKNKELNSLITQALRNNFDINIAIQNLKEVDLQYKVEKKNLLPEIFITSQFEKNILKKENFHRKTTNLYSLGLSTSYEVDIWGKIREGINIKKLNRLEKKFLYDSVLITIAGEVTKNWLNIVSLNEKEILYKKELKLREYKDFLLKNKYFSNQVSIDDIIDNKQQILNLKKELIKIKYEKKISKNILKLLLGEKGDFNLNIKTTKLPEISYPMDIGTPIDIIALRPDIKISEIKLINAFSDYKIARAQRFPKLTLSINHIYSDDELHSIFNNWSFSFIKSIIYPLLDFNRRKQEELIKKIEVNKSFIEYKKTIYNAIKEIENDFLDLRKSKEIIKIIQKKINEEKDKNKFLKLKYISNQRDLLNIVSSNINLIFYKRELIENRFLYLQNLVKLYKAIGGSYKIDRSTYE